MFIISAIPCYPTSFIRRPQYALQLPEYQQDRQNRRLSSQHRAYVRSLGIAANGYRLYTLDHLDQMRLARTALNTAWPGKTIRKAAFALIHQAARSDLGGALESAYRYLALVQTERNQAEMAAELVSRWAQGFPADTAAQGLHIRAALHLNVTSDQLRNWERNGLLDVPKDPHNNYRL